MPLKIHVKRVHTPSQNPLQDPSSHHATTLTIVEYKISNFHIIIIKNKNKLYLLLNLYFNNNIYLFIYYNRYRWVKGGLSDHVDDDEAIMMVMMIQSTSSRETNALLSLVNIGSEKVAVFMNRTT